MFPCPSEPERRPLLGFVTLLPEEGVDYDLRAEHCDDDEVGLGGPAGHLTFSHSLTRDFIFLPPAW